MGYWARIAASMTFALLVGALRCSEAHVSGHGNATAEQKHLSTAS